MKTIIIEDEYPNALRLQKMLKVIDPSIEILKILEGVKQSVQFLNDHTEVELIFLDIHLTDGTGFEILEQIQRSIPVIFTTAYDQYALDAFKHLSVDYLLKPIKEKALINSLEKYDSTFKNQATNALPLDQLIAYLKPQSFKTSFICRRGKNRYPLKTEQIAYFHFEDKEVWIKTNEGVEFLLPKTLDQLEKELNPLDFFRANRQIICSRAAIEKFEILPKSKIKLMIQPAPSSEIIISSEKSASFKKWIEE